jgi:hypothetical protein
VVEFKRKHSFNHNELKIKIAQTHKTFPAFHENIRFIAVFASRLLVHILSQINPVHILPCRFCKIQFNIIINPQMCLIVVSSFHIFLFNISSTWVLQALCTSSLLSWSFSGEE